jgi:hypothetical protein
MVDEARGTAPHDDVAAFETQAAHPTRAARAAPQEHGGQAERDGDYRSPGIILVAILMEAEFGAGDVSVDQASVGIVGGEPRLSGGACGKVQE